MHLLLMIILINIKHIYSDSVENKISNRFNSDFPGHIDKITTDKFIRKSRIPKFLTFNNDASHIRVEAVFAIPVLAIPIGGKSVNSGESQPAISKVDINLKSIISMAGIFFLLFFIIPKLVQIYLPQKLSPATLQMPGQQHLNTITKRIDEALNKFNVDVDSCTQKAICWTMNKSTSTNDKKKELNYLEKLIDTLNSIPYVNHFIEDTWLGITMKTISGFKNQDQSVCQKFDRKCSITQQGLSNAALKLAKYLYFPREKG